MDLRKVVEKFYLTEITRKSMNSTFVVLIFRKTNSRRYLIIAL